MAVRAPSVSISSSPSSVGSTALARAKLGPAAAKDDPVRDSNIQGRFVEKDGSINALWQPTWGAFNIMHFNIIQNMHWCSFAFLWAIIFMADFFFAGLLVMAVDWKREGQCFEHVDSFIQAFLFVFETAQTIGYGNRVPNPKCPDAIFITLIHIFFTTWLATFFAGTFLAKFSMTRTAGQSVRFSTQAIVTKRNGQLHLVLRVADHVESDMDYGAEVKAFLVTRGKGTDEPALLHLPLTFQLDGSGDTEAVPLLWPICVSHVMDSNSPLFSLGPEELAASGLEVIVTVAGGRESSGGIINCATSYTAKEIIWGRRFLHKDVLKANKEGGYTAYFGQEVIDRHEADESTPRMSGKQLAEERAGAPAKD
jgi:hypothetical protein